MYVVNLRKRLAGGHYITVARRTNSITLFVKTIERACENNHLVSFVGPIGTQDLLLKLSDKFRNHILERV